MRHAVVEKLVADHRNEFYLGWLYSQRASAALSLVPPRIDEAITDCRQVLEADEQDEFDDHARGEANAVMGYAYFLRGDRKEAQLWFSKVEEDFNPYEDWNLHEEPSEPCDSQRGPFAPVE